MATRRPKVPKVARNSPPAESGEGADVIRAHFGAGKERAAAEPKERPAGESRAGAAERPTAGHGKAARNTGKGSGKGSSAADAAHADPEEAAQPVPAKAFSGRMLALAVVMVAITIMLAPTVKVFFDKKAEIDALNADIAARQTEGDVLRQQVSRWQDPNYVKQQARDRINMVMPGETGYWVFGSDLPAGETSSNTGAAAQDPADLPWVDSLWESIRRAATE
ncbi:MAG: septum formation initiator family protein [Pseudarthrobacter sp.]|nr:septum formation initiator family protein [Pseudarthrobacter sp.]